MGFYRADLRMTYRGQAMQNTLWYRDRDPFSGDLIEQAALLGEKLNAHFFPALGAVLPTIIHETAHFDEWAVMPLEAIGFGPALSTPIVTVIDRDGSAGGEVMLPANVGILRFVLRPGLITSGLYQPRRSYLAVGPLSEIHVDEDGRLTDSVYGGWSDAAEVFALNVGTVAGAGGWAPVRYGNNGTLQGFAEVDGCTPRRATSWRRSRMPEA